jgi:hypothetical protein
MLMKQSNIYSLIATMINKFGGLFILQHAYHRLSHFLICLEIGFIINMIDEKDNNGWVAALC